MLAASLDQFMYSHEYVPNNDPDYDARINPDITPIVIEQERSSHDARNQRTGIQLRNHWIRTN